jgi:release factor glutamine methyltransferase
MNRSHDSEKKLRLFGACIGFTLFAGIVGLTQKGSLSLARLGKSAESHFESVVLGESEFEIRCQRPVPEFDKDLAVFETVFWDLRDTESLRELIRGSRSFGNKTVLEIGTGSGLLSLCCLKAGSKKVVATDVNPAAVANAKYNSERLGFSDRLEVRQVSLSDQRAFAVIDSLEKFDFVISNPPWVNRQPASIEELALYDENFELMKSLLADARQHLKPGGKLLLAYGCVDAVKTLIALAKTHGFDVVVLDSRNLDSLPEEFLPGMLVQLELK